MADAVTIYEKHDERIGSLEAKVEFFEQRLAMAINRIHQLEIDVTRAKDVVANLQVALKTKEKSE